MFDNVLYKILFIEVRHLCKYIPTHLCKKINLFLFDYIEHTFITQP